MNNFLEHHGIKGMKWGIRRYQNLDGSNTEAGKKRRRKTVKVKVKDTRLKNAKKDNKKLKKENEELKKRLITIDNSKETKKSSNGNHLSDSDLREAIERMQREATYKRLYAELNPEKTSAGKQFINSAGKILAKSTTDVASWGLTAAGKYVLKQSVSKKYGKDVASNIFGGK